MSAKEYIESKLDELKSRESHAKIKSGQNLEDFILEVITSKKFRKYKINPIEYIDHIKGSISHSIKNNLPIRLVFPFGGYKLWRLEETPEADWAELFSMMYFAKWLKPIALAYKPGVYFDFSSDDVVVERMNNISKSDTERYAKSFKDVIGFLERFLPENFKFTLTPVSSYYSEVEFENELKEKISEMEGQLGGLPVLDERHRKMVELNVKLNPDQDKDPLWKEKVELLHQSYYTLSKRRAYNRSKEKILAFCYRMDNCVAVGTTKTSIAKFWPGVGGLVKNGDDFDQHVLSPSQAGDKDFKWEEISISGLEGKNFHKIRVKN